VKQVLLTLVLASAFVACTANPAPVTPSGRLEPTFEHLAQLDALAWDTYQRVTTGFLGASPRSSSVADRLAAQVKRQAQLVVDRHPEWATFKVWLGEYLPVADGTQLNAPATRNVVEYTLVSDFGAPNRADWIARVTADLDAGEVLEVVVNERPSFAYQTVARQLRARGVYRTWKRKVLFTPRGATRSQPMIAAYGATSADTLLFGADFTAYRLDAHGALVRVTLR
jgi:hypothetical protein